MAAGVSDEGCGECVSEWGLLFLGMWLRFGAETRGFFDINLNSAQFNIGEFCCCCSGTGAEAAEL